MCGSNQARRAASFRLPIDIGSPNCVQIATEIDSAQCFNFCLSFNLREVRKCDPENLENSSVSIKFMHECADV